jgi:hypothetical protein
MNRLLAPAALLLAVAACSNQVGGNGTGTTAPGGAGGSAGGTATGGAAAGGAGGAATGGAGGTGGAGLPPCEQPGMTPNQPPPVGYKPFACDLPKPCPTLGFVSWFYGTAGTPTFGDPSAATCILTKLRDREVSALSWVNNRSGMGEFEDTEDLFIVDGEHAFANWTVANDLDLSSGTRNRQLLKPPAYFDGCLQLTDPSAIYACLIDWSAGCDDVPVSCPAP